MIGYSPEDEAIEYQPLTSMSDDNFREMDVTPVGPKNQVFEKFIDRIVCVSYFSQADEELDQCSVSIHQVRGGSIGLEYLAKLGHKKVVRVSGLNHHH